jgi:hypothetical protein
MSLKLWFFQEKRPSALHVKAERLKSRFQLSARRRVPLLPAAQTITALRLTNTNAAADAAIKAFRLVFLNKCFRIRRVGKNKLAINASAPFSLQNSRLTYFCLLSPELVSGYVLVF